MKTAIFAAAAAAVARRTGPQRRRRPQKLKSKSPPDGRPSKTIWLWTAGRTNKKRKNQSVSQTIDLIMTIKTSTGSSKTELSSRGKRPFKVRRSGANYGPCPRARKRPALITDPQKFGPTLNIGPAPIQNFKALFFCIYFYFSRFVSFDIFFSIFLSKQKVAIHIMAGSATEARNLNGQEKNIILLRAT